MKRALIMIPSKAPQPYHQPSHLPAEKAFTESELQSFDFYRLMIFENTGSTTEIDRVLSDQTYTKEEKYTRVTDLFLQSSKTLENNAKLWSLFTEGKHDEIIDLLGWKNHVTSKNDPVLAEKSPETILLDSLIKDLLEFNSQYTFVLEENQLYVKKNDNFVLLPNSNERLELGKLFKSADLAYIEFTPKHLEIFNQTLFVQSDYDKMTEQYRPPPFQTQLTHAERRVIYYYTTSGYPFINHMLAGRFKALKIAEHIQDSDISKVFKETLLKSALLVTALKKIRGEGVSTAYRFDRQLPDEIIQERIRAADQKSLLKEQAFISASMGRTSPQHNFGNVGTILLTATGASVSLLSGMPNENEILTPPGHFQYLAYQKLTFARGEVRYLFFAKALDARPPEWTDRLLALFSFKKNP